MLIIELNLWSLQWYIPNVLRHKIDANEHISDMWLGMDPFLIKWTAL